jgi:hypothetical protein
MNKLIHFNNTVYELSKSYGFKIDIYKIVETVDFQTGVRTIATTKYKVKKAVILPNQLYRDFRPIDPNYQFGGPIDIEKRGVLVNKKYLPKGFTLQENDYVVFNGDKYNVSDRHEMELADYIFFTIKKVHGESVTQIHDFRFVDRLTLTDAMEVV